MFASRRVMVVVAVALVAAIVVGTSLYLRGEGDDDRAAGLTVGWGGTDGQPSCVYDPQDGTVDCRLTIDGEAHREEQVTVTVTAYADENTSQPVGSSRRSVRVQGAVHLPLLVTIAVDRAPHVDEDGETACRLSVTY